MLVSSGLKGSLISERVWLPRSSVQAKPEPIQISAPYIFTLAAHDHGHTMYVGLISSLVVSCGRPPGVLTYPSLGIGNWCLVDEIEGISLGCSPATYIVILAML